MSSVVRFRTVVAAIVVGMVMAACASSARAQAYLPPKGEGSVSVLFQDVRPGKQDGAYFPCMIAAKVQVGGGDSGSVVLVRGIPAGVTSRTFGGWLGFTPLAEGLAELGLDLCTTPDCGLVPPPAAADRPVGPT